MSAFHPRVFLITKACFERLIEAVTDIAMRPPRHLKKGRFGSPAHSAAHLFFTRYQRGHGYLIRT